MRTAVTHAPRALEALAREAGVQRSYTDVRGIRRTASREALCAVLRVLGHDVDESGAGADGALRALRDGDRALVPPVAVAWDGRPAALDLDPAVRTRRVAWTARLEDGSERAGASGPGERPAGGGRLVLPAFPFGYHLVHAEVGGRTAATLVISAPRRTYAGPPRAWGVFLPLYALPGRFGPGDYTLLWRLVAWTAAHGGAVVGSTPLHAAFLDRPFDPSPYAPVSRRHWNELFVDPEAVPELDASADARRALAELPAGEDRLIDHRAAMAAKRGVLEALLEALDGARRAAFEERLALDPELAAYAGFRARCEREGGGWREWTG